MTESIFVSPADGPAAQAASRIWAVIPCGGSGTRAATARPKQYETVAGKMLIAHTLAAFLAVRRITEILVVVTPGDTFLSGLVQPDEVRWRAVARGGSSRAETVANGLADLQERGAADGDWVLVHDAVRCLVLPEWIDRLIDACASDPVGGLLAHPVADTLKLATGGRVAATPDRTHQWLAQTPQMFRIGMLRHALRLAGERVTDESSAMEALGYSPRLVHGSAANFKVTYPEDFALAHAVLARRSPPRTKDLDYDYP